MPGEGGENFGVDGPDGPFDLSSALRTADGRVDDADAQLDGGAFEAPSEQAEGVAVGDRLAVRDAKVCAPPRAAGYELILGASTPRPCAAPCHGPQSRCPRSRKIQTSEETIPGGCGTLSLADPRRKCVGTAGLTVGSQVPCSTAMLCIPSCALSCRVVRQ